MEYGLFTMPSHPPERGLCRGEERQRGGRGGRTARRSTRASPGARGSETLALEVLGEVASTSDAQSAETHYRQALGLASELGMRPLIAHCHLGLGKLNRRTGNRDQAEEHLTIATTMYREMGMPYWLEKAEAELKVVK
jgi:Tetratricopeptide repeat